jgi:parallel beta-helix repeat protein/predicted outer membrane repeat protein
MCPNEGNTASNNGGGIYAENSDLVINNLASLIQNNVANNSGGGVYAVDSIIDINDATVKDNTVQNNGGGIYLDSTNLTLKDATVSDNVTTEIGPNFGGGGLYLTGSSHATVDSSTILSNTSFVLGGGLLSVDSTDSISIINGSDIFNNVARFGAGIFTVSPLLVDNSRVFFNTVSQFGGGIHCNECLSLSVVNFSQISHNTASTSGGGVNIFSNNGTVVELINSSFAGNTVTDLSSSFGGGVSQDGGTLLIDTCNFTGNSGSTNGGGVSLFDLDSVVDSVRISIHSFLIIQQQMEVHCI